MDDAVARAKGREFRAKLRAVVRANGKRETKTRKKVGQVEQNSGSGERCKAMEPSIAGKAINHNKVISAVVVAKVNAKVVHWGVRGRGGVAELEGDEGGTERVGGRYDMNERSR